MNTIAIDAEQRQEGQFRAVVNPQDEVVRRAMEFNLGQVVARYRRDEGLTEEIALEHSRELKRFLAVCALNPSAHYGMKGPIDEIWHTFLIFSRDYASFCDQVAGRFIHHIPEPPRAQGEKGDAANYILFLNDYEKIFGVPAPAQYWPRPALALAGAGADCQGCNSCSQGEAFPSEPLSTTAHSEAHCGECNGCGDSG